MYTYVCVRDKRILIYAGVFLKQKLHILEFCVIHMCVLSNIKDVKGNLKAIPYDKRDDFIFFSTQVLWLKQ